MQDERVGLRAAHPPREPTFHIRAVALDPFLVVVAALFGGALLGVVGAALPSPPAAVQIAVREWLEYRREYGAA